VLPQNGSNVKEAHFARDFASFRLWGGSDVDIFSVTRRPSAAFRLAVWIIETFRLYV
jgi:hypothetical protein